MVATPLLSGLNKGQLHGALDDNSEGNGHTSPLVNDFDTKTYSIGSNKVSSSWNRFALMPSDLKWKSIDWQKFSDKDGWWL